MNRRSLIALGAFAAPAIIASSTRGQSLLPNRTIRIFVGFEAGGGADLTARAIAIQLQRRTGLRVTVENRTGSAGSVPAEILKKGPADGSELALMSSTTLVSKLATKNFPLDPLKDIAPVTQAGNFSIAFAVSPTLDVRKFDEYLEWLKSGDASRRRVAVSSNVAFVKVLNILLGQATGEMLEPVSYPGAVPMVADVQQGRIPATVNTLTSLLPSHRGRRIRILFHTGAERLSVARDIPTAIELGYPKLDMREWFAFFVSPATPAPIIEEWNRRLSTTLHDQSVMDAVGALGLEVQTSSPEALSALVKAHQKDWEGRMKNAGMEPFI